MGMGSQGGGEVGRTYPLTSLSRFLLSGPLPTLPSLSPPLLPLNSRPPKLHINLPSLKPPTHALKGVRRPSLTVVLSRLRPYEELPRARVGEGG